MNPIQQPIATGRTSEIFLYEEEKVLKLFFPTISQLWIDKETDTGRLFRRRNYRSLKFNRTRATVFLSV
jgi:hypothetical protein